MLCTIGATVASLYCNKATREAFHLLVTEFFSAVAQVTGQQLRFNVFDETAKLHSLVFDAEAAQMQGCGDALVAMKVNAGINGITTADPLELVLYVAKTCVIHFRR
jgi:hypothetical protein